MNYRIEFISGEHHPMRGVVFLISSEKKINAKKAFERLDEIGDGTLRRRFDMWQDKQPGRKRYHGFGGNYTNCFVFKCGKNNQDRFYGFLCKPKQPHSLYEVCVLISHIKKKKDETEESDLLDSKKCSENLTIRELLKKYFKGKQ